MLGPTGIIWLLFKQKCIKKDFPAFRKRLKVIFSNVRLFMFL